MPDTHVTSGQWRQVSGTQGYCRRLEKKKKANKGVPELEGEMADAPFTTSKPSEQLEALQAFGNAAPTLCGFYQQKWFGREAFFLYRRGTSMKHQTAQIISRRVEQLRSLGPVSVAWGSGGQNGSFGKGLCYFFSDFFFSFFFFFACLVSIHH